jgi:predicted N-acetyltransferase YhbS
MFLIREEKPADNPEIKRLVKLGFASSHAKRNIWALREGDPVASLCLVAEDESTPGHLLGSIRYWPITIAGQASLLLGPLAVDPVLRGQGIGRGLVLQSLERAKAESCWHWCFVSGERNYYPDLGFSRLEESDVDLPVYIEEERLHLIAISGNSLDQIPERPLKIRPASKI